MTFELQYEQDFKRVIPAVINDSRWAILGLKDQPGSVVYAYAQSQVVQVVPGVLVYRIVTETGNLAGYVALQVQNMVASVLFTQLRPAFLSFSTQISNIIANFITEGLVLQDLLY